MNRIPSSEAVRHTQSNIGEVPGTGSTDGSCTCYQALVTSAWSARCWEMRAPRAQIVVLGIRMKKGKLAETHEKDEGMKRREKLMADPLYLCK